MSTPLLLLLLSSVTIPNEGLRAIPPGHEAEILALAAPIELGAPVAAGYRLGNIGIEGRAFTFLLEGEGLEPIRLRVTPDEQEQGARIDVSPSESGLSPAGEQAVEHLRATVLPRIDGAFWQRVLAAPSMGREIRSAPLSAAPAFATVLATLALILLLEVRGGASFRSGIIALLLAIAPLVVWYVSWRLAGIARDPGELEAWLQQREHHLVQLTLAVAIAGLTAAAFAAFRRWRRIELDRGLCLDTTLVLGWSLFVRFGLTAANVLTDGGSGWSRLLEYRRGFGGLAVLLDWVLPGASMWDSILVPRLLAALSPPLLVLLALAAGARRRTAAFAGLAFASWPLHAALYSSDFESGAIVTVLLGGLTLVALSRQRDTALGLAAGLTLLGFGIWGRPEALVVGLPLLVFAWGVPRNLWTRPVVVAAVTWLGGLAVIRLASLSELANGSRENLVGPWSVLPLGELLTTSALLPYWLWLPLPLGALWLRGRTRVLALAGLFAGIVPLHVTPTMFDPTGTYLEFFRYGAFAMPWLALLAGAGLAATTAALFRLIPQVAPAPAVAVVLWLVATPLLNRDYLGIRYGPAVDEEAFREALTQIPAGCRLIVPDDPGFYLDVLKRYVEITRDVSLHDPGALPVSSVVGVSSVLRNLPIGDGCWYFYRGSYCHDGFEGVPPIECRELLDREPFQPVWSRAVEYRSHRLVSRPKRTVPPWYEPRLRLTLYRLGTVSSDSLPR